MCIFFKPEWHSLDCRNSSFLNNKFYSYTSETWRSPWTWKKKWDWETNNSINKSFSSNVVPGRFLMDEIKHFHLHLPPDRARIYPSSWSAELRHQTDTARAETAADTYLSPRFNSNNNNSFSGNVLAFKAAHFWSASIWVWAHSDTRAQGGGSAAAAVAVARAVQCWTCISPVRNGSYTAEATELPRLSPRSGVWLSALQDQLFYCAVDKERITCWKRLSALRSKHAKVFFGEKGEARWFLIHGTWERVRQVQNRS